MPTVGLIGVGLLGSAIAERLLSAGYQVVGFDVAQQRRAALQQLGGEVAASTSAVVERCNVIILSLPDSKFVGKVIESATEFLRAGVAIIDTSTGDPEHVVKIAALLGSRSVEYLDATVLGSSEQTRVGEAIVMVGASEKAFECYHETIRSFAREVFHVGPPGNGSRMKLVVNLVLGLNRAALAEGLALARLLQLDDAMALAVLRAGAAYSKIMDTKGDKMLSDEFAPQARLSQHLKDVRLMLAAAARTGGTLPLSDAHRQLLEKAEAAGCGELDNSAIIKAYDLR
jgi:3-hydroxyisobutyrate dehydrogenase-like beta-hydroxyacid dehydrogenase